MSADYATGAFRFAVDPKLQLSPIIIALSSSIAFVFQNLEQIVAYDMLSGTKW